MKKLKINIHFNSFESSWEKWSRNNNEKMFYFKMNAILF